MVFLREALKRVRAAGYRLVNVDSTLVLAAPKIGPHATAIRTRLSELLGLAPDCIGLKAKTPEGMGTDNAAIAHVVVLVRNEGRIERNASQIRRQQSQVKEGCRSAVD